MGIINNNDDLVVQSESKESVSSESIIEESESETTTESSTIEVSKHDNVPPKKRARTRGGMSQNLLPPHHFGTMDANELCVSDGGVQARGGGVQARGGGV